MKNQRVTGQSKLLGIIGNPLKHSLSPVFHNHLLKELELPYVYVPFEITKKELIKDFLSVMKNTNLKGLNVTIPYKTEVLKYCDFLSDIAEKIGAVNTLLFNDDNTIYGTTTDAEGFFKSLEINNFNISDKNVIILGNGGTARTLCMAIALQNKIKSITIAGRNIEKINNLAEEITLKTGFNLYTTTLDKLQHYANSCNLLINTTSVGMHPQTDISPVDKEIFHPKMFVYDVIYNPRETKFIKYAKEKGCKTLNGIYMLIYQGLESFKIWTGIYPNPRLINVNNLYSILEKSNELDN